MTTSGYRHVKWSTLAAYGVSLAPVAVALASPPTSDYRLVFADEFNGTALDTSKWSAASPSWTMPNSLSTASASQVAVRSGELTLTATRTSGGGSTQFSSGSVSSYQKYSFTGGYVEARIDLPSTPGSWPAFWGLYTGWPPEMDIMEYPLTTDGGTNGYPSNAYHTAYHYTNSSGSAAAGAGEVTTSQNLGTTGYHTFGMEWVTNTSVNFYFDGAKVSSYTGDSVKQMACMYMILDYAAGGWPGTPSTSQWAIGASDQMKVDWVRVWQKNPNSDAASTWSVNGGGSFTTSSNWTGGGVPNYSNQTAIFGRVGNAAAATIAMDAWQVFGGITFSGGSDGTTAYTIGSSGNAIQLASTTGSCTVQASSSSTVSQTIGAKVELWSNTTFRNDMTGGQTLNLNGQISGAGKLTVDGLGTTVLNTANTYTGGTVIDSAQAGAVLRVNASGALGTGDVVLGTAGNGTTARLEIAGGSTLANNIDFRGRTNSSVAIQSRSGNNTISGTLTANVGGNIYQIQSDADTLTLTGAASTATTPGVALQAYSGDRIVTLQGAGNGIISGKVQNGGGNSVSITKTGAGTWTLSAANTYTGNTTVNGGTLLVTNPTGSGTGTGNVSVNSGGLLGGTGRVSGAVTINAGGAIAPGASIGSLATGNLSFASASSALDVELALDGTPSADLLNVTGTVSLSSATLDVSLLSTASDHQPRTFLLISNDGTDAITGSFGTIVRPAGYQVTVDSAYLGTDVLGRIGSGNDLAVTIVAVPEPSCLAVLGLATAGILHRRRRASGPGAQ